MLRKLGAGLRRKQGGVNSSVKCRFDVNLESLEGLPSKVSRCRIQFERSPRVQMSKIQSCSKGRCEPNEVLSFVATMFGSIKGFEKKEYWVKIQVPAKAGEQSVDNMITLGKVSLDLADYAAQVQERDLDVNLKIPLKVGGLKATLRATMNVSIVQARTDMDAISDLSGMSGMPDTTSGFDMDQDLSGFSDYQSGPISPSVKPDRTSGLSSSKSVRKKSSPSISVEPSSFQLPTRPRRIGSEESLMTLDIPPIPSEPRDIGRTHSDSLSEMSGGPHGDEMSTNATSMGSNFIRGGSSEALKGGPSMDVYTGTPSSRDSGHGLSMEAAYAGLSAPKSGPGNIHQTIRRLNMTSLNQTSPLPSPRGPPQRGPSSNFETTAQKFELADTMDSSPFVERPLARLPSGVNASRRRSSLGFPVPAQSPSMSLIEDDPVKSARKVSSSKSGKLRKAPSVTRSASKKDFGVEAIVGGMGTPRGGPHPPAARNRPSNYPDMDRSAALSERSASSAHRSVPDLKAGVTEPLPQPASMRTSRSGVAVASYYNGADSEVGNGMSAPLSLGHRRRSLKVAGMSGPLAAVLPPRTDASLSRNGSLQPLGSMDETSGLTVELEMARADEAAAGHIISDLRLQLSKAHSQINTLQSSDTGEIATKSGMSENSVEEDKARIKALSHEVTILRQRCAETGTLVAQQIEGQVREASLKKEVAKLKVTNIKLMKEAALHDSTVAQLRDAMRAAEDKMNSHKASVEARSAKLHEATKNVQGDIEEAGVLRVRCAELQEQVSKLQESATASTPGDVSVDVRKQMDAQAETHSKVETNLRQQMRALVAVVETYRGAASGKEGAAAVEVVMQEEDAATRLKSMERECALATAAVAIAEGERSAAALQVKKLQEQVESLMGGGHVAEIEKERDAALAEGKDLKKKMLKQQDIKDMALLSSMVPAHGGPTFVGSPLRSAPSASYSTGDLAQETYRSTSGDVSEVSETPELRKDMPVSHLWAKLAACHTRALHEQGRADILAISLENLRLEHAELSQKFKFQTADFDELSRKLADTMSDRSSNTQGTAVSSDAGLLRKEMNDLMARAELEGVQLAGSRLETEEAQHRANLLQVAFQRVQEACSKVGENVRFVNTLNEEGAVSDVSVQSFIAQSQNLDPNSVSVDEVTSIINDRDTAMTVLNQADADLSHVLTECHLARAYLNSLEEGGLNDAAEGTTVLALKKEITKLTYQWGAEKEELAASRDDAEASVLEMQAQMQQVDMELSKLRRSKANLELEKTALQDQTFVMSEKQMELDRAVRMLNNELRAYQLGSKMKSQQTRDGKDQRDKDREVERTCTHSSDLVVHDDDRNYSETDFLNVDSSFQEELTIPLKDFELVIAELAERKLELAVALEGHTIMRHEIFKARERNIQLSNRVTTMETAMYAPVW